ncbi:hypothetical protein PG995_007132 [Apiospora arundinis]
METNEKHLLALAEAVTAEHGLGPVDVMSLADDVAEGVMRRTTYPSPEFENLVISILDVSKKVPEWLGMSEQAVNSFSESQVEIVMYLIEARFWHGTLEQDVGYFWYWHVVFGTAWKTHCQVVSEERIKGFPDLVRKNSNKLLPWVDLLSNRYKEDFGKVCEALRAKYFPEGIADARAGFFKHHKKTGYSYEQLKKRCQLIKEYFGQGSPFIKACDELLRDTEKLLPRLYKIAKIWGKNTHAQKEWYQLPGNSIGLTYSWVTRVDLGSNTYEICLLQEDGKTRWNSFFSHQTPIRMDKGSAWRHYLGNQQQPDLNTIRRCSADEKAEEPDEQEGPLEVNLPQSLYPILHNYFRKYRVAERLARTLEGQVVKDDKMSNELAMATGEDYWKTRGIKIRHTETDYEIVQDGLLNGRPRFDAAHNLRMDYLNAALKDLRSRAYVKDARSDQAGVVLKGVDGT